MPKIQVAHNSSLPPTDAFEKIKEFFATDSTLQKLDSNVKAQYDDKTRKGAIKGSQFKADVSVEASGAGSKISVVIDLPLLLTPFKGKVEETLHKKLQKYLA
jgi:hypothetical protein